MRPLRSLVWAAGLVVLGWGCARATSAVAGEPARAAVARGPVRGAGPGGLRADRCGDVSAEWQGEVDDVATFFTGLQFRFADGSVAPYQPRGEVFPPDWPADVFSPDCSHAVLPLDHYGPLAVVPLTKLREFLASGQGATLAQADAGSGPAQVVGEARWTGGAELEFTASCCGGASVWRASTSGAVQQVFFAGEAPKGVERFDGGYRVRP